MKKLACIILGLIIGFSGFSANALSTSAKAAILINGDTGEVIYEQNPDVTLPMASTTKIMTALLLCEHGEFEREIVVTEEMLRVEGSSMGLLSGDIVTLHDLLYGLMLASGNDAANVIAYVLGGTVNGFVAIMNRKAQELNLANTHFATPSGLDGDGHYTTARDLANLTMFAMQNEEFAKAAGSKTATLNYGNPPYRRTLTNHNKLLGSFEGAVGVKTGFTKKSGRCLVSAAKKDGKFVIAVTLNAPDDWLDHENLLSYGLSAINQVEIKPEISEFDIPVIGGEVEKLHITIEPYVVNSLGNSEFSVEVCLPSFIYAPIKKDDIIGNVTYKSGNLAANTVNIYANSDINAAEYKEKNIAVIINNIKYIFEKIWEK